MFPNLFYAGYTANGLGNHVLANEYLTRALDVQNKSGARIFSEPDSMEVAKVYSEFYASRNDYRAAYLAYQQFSPKFNPNPIIKQNEVNARRASYNIYKYQQQKLINELENKLHIESEQKQETIFIVC
ncbi:MAG: hypothetical protein IPL74_15360 [Bacteroidetes bacterium]|nr:hypothetical protein [Bacteroidota bacterium]